MGAQVMELLKQVAAEIVQPNFRRLTAEQIEEKTPGDYVTAADRASEVALTQGLQEMYPDAVIVGEEACFTDPKRPELLADAPRAFTVDPIDGTGNYVRGSTDHCLMIAEVQNGETVRSWIYQPEYDLAYFSELGGGAWCNGKRMTAPEAKSTALVGAVSLRHAKGFVADERLAPAVNSWHSAGIDYPHLANGDVDYLLFRSARHWDHLPGLVMLQELGGDIWHLDGTPYRAASSVKRAILAATQKEKLPELTAAWQAHGKKFGW